MNPNDFLKWLQNNLHTTVAAPTIVSFMQFLYMLIQSASDGVIDNKELYQLMTMGSGFNLIVLLAVYVFLKIRKK